MSSDIAPLVVGLAAAGLLLLLTVIVPAARRLFKRTRARTRHRQRRVLESWTARQEPDEPPEAPSKRPAESSSSTAEVDIAVAEQSEHGPDSSVTAEGADQDSDALPVAAGHQPDRLEPETKEDVERTTENAHRRALELLEEAELEAKRIVVAAGQERTRLLSDVELERAAMEETRTRLDSIAAIQDAEQRADALVAAAALQCESRVRESEAEAERRAADIAASARRQAQELLEEAELEAKRIVVSTSQERAQLLNELAHERAVLEEARVKLASLDAIEDAQHKAEELLVAVELRRENILREREAEAERRAATITEDAQRRAQEMLEEAESEANRIVDSAGQERAQLLRELERERAAFEEKRSELLGFLADVLEKADTAGVSDEPSSVSDVGKALTVTTSPGAS